MNETLLGRGIAVVIVFLVFPVVIKWRARRITEEIRTAAHWSSPLFYNGAFWGGFFLLLIAAGGLVFVFQPNSRNDVIVGSITAALAVVVGVFLFWATPFVVIQDDRMTYEPLLGHLFGLPSLERSVLFRDMIEVSFDNLKTKYGNSPIRLVIGQKNGAPVKISTLWWREDAAYSLKKILTEKIK